MKIRSFIHPGRCVLPCSGVGRHSIGVLQQLQDTPEVDLDLLFAEEWQQDGALPAGCPLRDLPFLTFPGRQNPRERFWKLLGGPQLNPSLTAAADWIYCPMETRLPVRNAPVAFTLHDVQPFEPGLPWSRTPGHRRNRRMWGLWLPKALKEARVVFTVSEFSKRRMIELLGVPEDKIEVSGNGVDPVYFEPSPGPGSPHPPYVLLVGGLRREKGGLETLEVARRLRRLLPDLEFHVAGMPNDPALVEQARELGNFRFLGMVPDAGLPGLYRGAVCLLFLSLYEGFGMPPLEAMACGTPVICSDQASLPEIVGEAAVVLPPGSADEVAGWIREMESSSGVRDDFARRGRRHASDFTWARVADRVLMALSSRC